MWPAAVVLLGLASPAPSAEAVREAVREVFASHRYQDELPARVPEPPAEAQRSPRDATPGSAAPPPTSRHLPPPRHLPPARSVPPAASLGQVAWLLCLAALVLGVTVALLRRGRRGRSEVAEPTRPRADAGQPVRAPDPLDPDRLAAEGRYAEAIHALLQRTLAQIAGPSPLAPALTGREVLASVSLGPRRREALEPLVVENERVHFARRPASADDYERCRAQARLVAGSPR